MVVDVSSDGPEAPHALVANMRMKYGPRGTMPDAVVSAPGNPTPPRSLSLIHI